MKTLKKVVIALLILIMVTLVAGGLFVRQVARKALPDYNQSVVLNGLQDGVRIYRDQHAIPYIYANNEQDLYMAVGYVMAQDRLWQMDLLRRVTTGRLSEIFGEDMIGADQLLRALRIPEKSARVLAGSDPSLQQAMAAFSRGVNQYIEQNLKKLPPEFTLLGYQPEPWQPLHSANLVGYMSWDLSGSWGTEVVLHKLRDVLDEEKFMQIIPNMDYHQTFVFPEYQYDTPADPHAATAGTTPPCRKPAGSYQDMFGLLDHAGHIRDLGLEVFSGSNSWVVSGEHTETGLPLFANDMHLGFGAPGIWMQMHQVVEGKLNVSGVALPGQPFIIVGHNENIAWGMTNLYVDETDFYMETTDASKPGQYLFNGEWKDMLAVNEQIAVKGADTVERVNMFTHRGPVISTFKSLDDQVVSMRWTGNEYSNEMRTIYLLNRASNWDEFKDALTSFISISQNITYADVHGNIGQQAAGGVPVRKEGNGMFVSPGDTDQYDWIRLLPLHELPYVFNPSSGQVSAANNRTVDDNYPHVIGHWFDTPNRIQRIRELLDEKELFGPGDFQRMMTDVHSKLAERVIEELAGILSVQQGLSDNEQKAVDILRKWEGDYPIESIAASIFETFFQVLMKNIMIDEIGETLYQELNTIFIRNMFEHIWATRESAWINNIHTAHAETFEEVVFQSFRESVQWLESNYGENPDQWAWGSLYQLTISHPMGSVSLLDRIFGLNKGPYPMPGSFHTVGNNAYSFHKPFDVLHGASQRHIYNLADWSDNYVRIPTGTSGIPASKYYLDQTDAFVKATYYQKAWKKEDVIATARYTTMLVPAR